MTRLKWKLDSFCLETVLILGQDRCMVCFECTIGLEIILAHFEILLILTQDGCKVCAERTIGSDVILDAPDGTPS